MQLDIQNGLSTSLVPGQVRVVLVGYRNTQAKETSVSFKRNVEMFLFVSRLQLRFVCLIVQFSLRNRLKCLQVMVCYRRRTFATINLYQFFQNTAQAKKQFSIQEYNFRTVIKQCANSGFVTFVKFGESRKDNN